MTGRPGWGGEPFVSVEHVSKKFSRNANGHRAYGLSDLLREIAGRRRGFGLREDEFFAVNDVSFQLRAGESLGLIGRNGAGKSSLLRMLNGLIKPDAGRIVTGGRVQALINLGAGFNPLLSGRDNVYNAAALMGMSQRDTREVFTQIVEFADLAEFIDGPVQTYSSGMRARLGFAVAAHLQPDILLIDEVLAVGDFAFQNKCLVRLQELKKRGAAIVLVSHSHTHMIQICERGVWLDRGRVMAQGSAREAVGAYLEFLEEQESRDASQANAGRGRRRERVAPGRPAAAARTLAPGRIGKDDRGSPAPAPDVLYHAIHGEFDRIADLRVSLLVGGREADVIRLHDDVTIEYSFRLRQPVRDLNVSLVIYRKDGLQITTMSTLNGDLVRHKQEGAVTCRARIRDFNLSPGRYVLVMPIHEGKSYLYRDVVKEFVVKSGGRLAWNIIDFDCEYEVEP